MSRIDIDGGDKEELNFKKIYRTSATHQARHQRGIPPTSKASRRLNIVKDRPLERLRFLSDDPKIGHLTEKYIEGFTDLGLIFNFDQAMAEFDTLSNENDVEDCWVDTSFMMKPTMSQGTHTKYGFLELCEPSFLHVLTNRFQSSEDYKETAQEIRRTNKAHTRLLRTALENPYVFTPPQMVSEVINGIEGFNQQLRTHTQKGHSTYAIHLRERLNRLKLISDTLTLDQSTHEEPLVKDPDLERRLFDFCQRSSSERRNNVTLAGNHLVAYAMARLMETGKSQRILTRSKKVMRLAYDLAHPTIRESFEIPRLVLENSYCESPRLHTLNLSLK